MSGLEIIATALAAGAATGVSGVASSAVQETYQRLKTLLTGKLADHPSAVRALSADETDPGFWQTHLDTGPTTTARLDDEEIIAAARHLLSLTGNPATKTHINAEKAQGVQIGDNNEQWNTFH